MSEDNSHESWLGMVTGRYDPKVVMSPGSGPERAEASSLSGLRAHRPESLEHGRTPYAHARTHRHGSYKPHEDRNMVMPAVFSRASHTAFETWQALDR